MAEVVTDNWAHAFVAEFVRLGRKCRWRTVMLRETAHAMLGAIDTKARTELSPTSAAEMAIENVWSTLVMASRSAPIHV